MIRVTTPHASKLDCMPALHRAKDLSFRVAVVLPDPRYTVVYPVVDKHTGCQIIAEGCKVPGSGSWWQPALREEQYWVVNHLSPCRISKFTTSKTALHLASMAVISSNLSRKDRPRTGPVGQKRTPRHKGYPGNGAHLHPGPNGGLLRVPRLLT